MDRQVVGDYISRALPRKAETDITHQGLLVTVNDKRLGGYLVIIVNVTLGAVVLSGLGPFVSKPWALVFFGAAALQVLLMWRSDRIEAVRRGG